MLRASLEKLYIQSEELGPMQRKSRLKNCNKSLYVSGLWMLPYAGVGFCCVFVCVGDSGWETKYDLLGM